MVIDPEIKDIVRPLNDKETAKEWVIINQLGRRNLTPQEASYYRGKLYESKKQHPHIHPKSEGKNFPRFSSTAEEIGKKYGVTDRTIKNDAEFSKVVDKVAEEISKEAKDAILTGKANVPKKDVER